MKHCTILILLFSSVTLFATQPEWVKSYGTHTPYPSSHYITGFSMIDRDESQSDVLAKEKAIADLSGKIQTMVFSEITLKEFDDGSNYNSSASIITKNTVNISVSGVEYLIHQDQNNSYALAFVSREDLSRDYSDKGLMILTEIISTKIMAKDFIDKKDSNSAFKELYKIETDFINFYEQYSLLNSINSNNQFFRAIESFNSLEDVKRIEMEITLLMNDLEERSVSTLSEAINKISLILLRQDIKGGNISLAPLNYETTGFSSEFGRYASSLLETELIKNLHPGNMKTIIRGNYWEEENTINLRVLVINEDGNKIGQSSVSFQRSTIPAKYSLKPQNFEESMIALREFADGAITDGGINIGIWTNKGRDNDSLVYEEGETLELFMRVNQPAFLQITYKLATGENILLENSFYIGIDKVNRAVKLPYDFEVTSPLGIEQLIVTAYSVEPPRANTVMKTIDGESYEVFATDSEITAMTRGIKRKQDINASDIRVGEAMLSLTTVRK